jgi:uncharacterized cupin superfamily protein
MSHSPDATSPVRPVLHLAEQALQPRPAAWQPPPGAAARIDARMARLAPLMGLRHLGCSLVEVPPGKQAFPFHGHRHNDELFVLLQGAGTLRLGGRQWPVRAGDVVGCPAGGPESAHALVNDGAAGEPLRYLALSSQHRPEICDYPDSGKFGVFDEGPEGAPPFFHLARTAGGVDYWDGE